MLLDADDWVERGLVAAARAGLGPERVGGVLETGALVDIRSGRTAELPDSRIFDGPFHRVCGSSGVFRLQPNAAEPFRRNPLSQLPVHSRWFDDARARGAELAKIEGRAAYVVNTGQNNSETIGPHADWKKGVVREVNRSGRSMTEDAAWGWGLTRTEIAAVHPAEAA